MFGFPFPTCKFSDNCNYHGVDKEKSIYRTETLVNSHFYIRYSEATTRGVL